MSTSNFDSFWKHCLECFEAELPAQQFATWIKPIQCVTSPHDDCSIKLIAPNRFVQQWIRERYLPRIIDLSQKFFEQAISIDLVVANIVVPIAKQPVVTSLAEHYKKEPITKSVAMTSTGTDVTQISTQQQNHSRYERTRLNIDLTFESLVTGKANQLAHAASIQVSESPGRSYNPLFVYGGVGLGKTHLIQSIGNTIYKSNPNAEIRYIHANDYYADVVKAYQQGSFDVFSRYYRSLDVLLIDDIQFFNNKTRTQEEFFHAFNALIEAHKQIIITCDTYPKDIAGLSDRLVSRFDWGLTVAIEPPELEMRVAILNKKAYVENIQLDETVSFLIAKHLKSNVRELEGALNKVVAYARFHGREITIDVAKDALKDLLNAFNRQITIDLIQRTVADYYKIKVADLYSKKRTVNIARPRQIAMALARELTPSSFPAIGEAFGGRDHTTILHACRNIAELRQKDTQINHDFHVLLQVLKS